MGTVIVIKRDFVCWNYMKTLSLYSGPLRVMVAIERHSAIWVHTRFYARFSLYHCHWYIMFPSNPLFLSDKTVGVTGAGIRGWGFTKFQNIDQSYKEPTPCLTHWGRDKMAAFSQTTLSNAFSWLKILEFRLKIHWSLFLRFLSTISQHWFWLWLGTDQATSHYLNQCWLYHWRIYASLGLN